jgi:PleD family two-component response regulator
MPADLPSDPVEQARQLNAARDELDRLRLTLEVVGTMDLDAGILNRNGLLESLERGRRWLDRRGDIFGALVVRFPAMPVLDPQNADDLEIIKHLAATIGAGVREVDEVARIDETTYGASLADLKPGAIQVVADRVRALLEATVRGLPQVGSFTIGAIEVLNSGHTSGAVLDTALRLADGAAPGAVSVGQI